MKKLLLSIKQKWCCCCTTSSSNSKYTSNSGNSCVFGDEIREVASCQWRRHFRVLLTLLVCLVAVSFSFLEWSFAARLPPPVLASAAASASAKEHLSEAAAAAAASAPVQHPSATEEQEEEEEETLAPRVVRVAIVGGGITGAATATFLSILEKQLHYERMAKQQIDKKRRKQEEESSSTEFEEAEVSSEMEDDETDEETDDRWWMRRPIKFQLDLYEGAERFGGRMEYGEIAGRTVELGDVGVNASNFWMTVFHDLLNEFADNLGGTGWTTHGDHAAAAPKTAAGTAASETAATAAAEKATAQEATAEEAGTTVGQASTAAHEVATAADEAVPAAEVQIDVNEHRRTTAEVVPSVEEFTGEGGFERTPCENQHQEGSFCEQTGEQQEREEQGPEQDDEPQYHMQSTLEDELRVEDYQVEKQGGEKKREKIVENGWKNVAGASGIGEVPAKTMLRPQIHLYTTGWKHSFTFPSPLTEFQGVSPGPTVLLHDTNKVTPIASLTLALIKSGATALSESLKSIVFRWQRIYDFTFGGSMCAKRAAISLFPGRAHYIAPHPSRQHPNGRPYCSVIEQAKAATTSGVKVAEALGLGNEIKQPFSTLLKPYPIERAGVHLIDSLIRGVYSQRAKYVHTLAGALAVAGTFEAPYDRKRYSGRVLVQFLIARAADKSFLHCPIAKVVELEDEVVSLIREPTYVDSAQPQSGDIGTEAAGNMNNAGESSDTFATDTFEKQHAFASPTSTAGIITKRRKRFKVEPADDEVCSNLEARQHLEKTIYDFVIIAAPLEDSPLTLYRRVSRQRGGLAKDGTATGKQNSEVGAQDMEFPNEDNGNPRFKKIAAVNVANREEESESNAESPGDAENGDSEQRIETATTTNNVDALVQSGQFEGVDNSFQEGERHRLDGEDQWQNMEGIQDFDRPPPVLEEVIVPERAFAAAQTTCAAADGLVKYRPEDGRMYRVRSSEKSERPSPTTVLTSDSLSNEYFSFGELFVATCHSVVDSEVDTPTDTTPNATEGKSSLLFFFSQKREDQKRRKHDGNNDTSGDEKMQDPTETTNQATAVSQATPDETANDGSAVRNWKINAELLSQLSAAKLERQENEEGSSRAKTLYYTGKSVSPLAAEGFFSRIKGSTSLSRHLGQTICCAVTANELDDRDITDVFKNVSHLDRRSWDFAGPKMYPVVDRKKRDKPAVHQTAQTYIWGEKEESPPPTVRPEVTNFVLMENVFYPSAFENVVSFSEGAVMSAKNVANLVIKKILEDYDD